MEIHLRAYNLETHQIYPHNGWYYSPFGRCAMRSGTKHWAKELVVQIGIGINDKNGNEIFTGDVLCASRMVKVSLNRKVRCQKQNLEVKTSFEIMELIKKAEYEFEIIGNILDERTITINWITDN